MDAGYLMLDRRYRMQEKIQCKYVNNYQPKDSSYFRPHTSYFVLTIAIPYENFLPCLSADKYGRQNNPVAPV